MEILGLEAEQPCGTAAFGFMREERDCSSSNGGKHYRYFFHIYWGAVHAQVRQNRRNFSVTKRGANERDLNQAHLVCAGLKSEKKTEEREFGTPGQDALLA